MTNRRCKYCNSEMDLMESAINYEHWICMNENCNATLTLDEKYDWEQWQKDGVDDF